jgi:hypothetical protein
MSLRGARTSCTASAPKIPPATPFINPRRFTLPEDARSIDGSVNGSIDGSIVSAVVSSCEFRALV